MLKSKMRALVVHNAVSAANKASRRDMHKTDFKKTLYAKDW
jgi:hypothetical protein